MIADGRAAIKPASGEQRVRQSVLAATPASWRGAPLNPDVPYRTDGCLSPGRPDKKSFREDNAACTLKAVYNDDAKVRNR